MVLVEACIARSGKPFEDLFLLVADREEIQNWMPLVSEARAIIERLNPPESFTVALNIIGRLARRERSIGVATMSDLALGPLSDVFAKRDRDAIDGLVRATALTLIYGEPHRLHGQWERILKNHPDFTSKLESELLDFSGEDHILAFVRAAHGSPDFLPIARQLVAETTKNKYFQKHDPKPFLEMFLTFGLCLGPSVAEGLLAFAHAPGFWRKVMDLPDLQDRLDVLVAYTAPGLRGKKQVRRCGCARFDSGHSGA